MILAENWLTDRTERLMLYHAVTAWRISLWRKRVSVSGDLPHEIACDSLSSSCLIPNALLYVILSSWPKTVALPCLLCRVLVTRPQLIWCKWGSIPSAHSITQGELCFWAWRKCRYMAFFWIQILERTAIAGRDKNYDRWGLISRLIVLMYRMCQATCSTTDTCMDPMTNSTEWYTNQFAVFFESSKFGTWKPFRPDVTWWE